MLEQHPRPAARFDPLRALSGVLVIAALVIAWSPARAGDDRAIAPATEAELEGLPPEVPDDPPGKPAVAPPGAHTATIITFGRFTHVQVNVSPAGANIPGDAANEPSITVDPTNHTHMAIGWRQFDTITSNFRQAGVAFTTNEGATWTKSTIDPGVFRSDPVLASDLAGKFFYNSLMGNFTSQIYPSTNGGATWGASTFAFGGDKQWMTIDRTSGTGSGFQYQAWSTAGNNYPPNTFDRSINGGASFQSPSVIPLSPVWGTLSVGPDGTLYLVGTDGPGPGGTIFVARSTNAKNGVVTPTFTTVSVNLGGTVRTGALNPAGLLGQLWIDVDRSNGPRSGWVYLLASVQTATDPLDVMFTRSSDGGQTWSAPVRVNDDPTSNRAFQWFGSLSVAPDGRLEAVWNDTRGSADSTMSALYYSFSNDGGVTWSPNEQASPVWNSTVGWPNQNKIGDYYHMVSDLNGADLAWAATFNGEEDVYYLRIPRLPPTAVLDPGRSTRLHPAVPDPFTSATEIAFDLPPAGGRVRLEVFDVAGRRVATLVNGTVSGGPHVARWNGLADGTGRDTPPGLYLCRLEAAGQVETRRLMRIR